MTIKTICICDITGATLPTTRAMPTLSISMSVPAMEPMAHMKLYADHLEEALAIRIYAGIKGVLASEGLVIGEDGFVKRNVPVASPGPWLEVPTMRLY